MFVHYFLLFSAYDFNDLDILFHHSRLFIIYLKYYQDIKIY